MFFNGDHRRVDSINLAILIYRDEQHDTKLRWLMLFNSHTCLQKQLSAQPSLFTDEQDEREARLDQVVDQIRNHFGTTSLRRASSVQHNADKAASTARVSHDVTS